ncbi:hypothetical protein [Peribacillus asahii]|uniref:hypothetical protein n=1 Tax=Peribacillus asahii TaxID=228899 RepID=UPI0037F6A56E
MNCKCYSKEVQFLQDAIEYALKLRTVYIEPIIVTKADEKQEFEVIIVSPFCETHSIMVLLPVCFPNIVHTM